MTKSICLLFHALAFGPLLCAAAAAPRVVAPGNPPLTSDMALKAASFYEWVLDARFTPAQQQEYEQMIARNWSDEDHRKSVNTLLQNVDNLASMPADNKSRVLRQVRHDLLESFRKDANDPDARWMLAIYNAAHPSGAAPGGVSQYPALDARQIVGKWRETKGSAVQYADSRTGSLAPTNGSSFFYEFHPDGTYDYNGLMQVTMYSCSTQIFNTEGGKYRVQGDRIFFEVTKGVSKAQQTCGSNKYTEKPAELTTKESLVHFQTEGNATVLVIENPYSAAKPDYFRAVK